MSLPINFFLKIFFPQILLGWLILRFGGVFSVVFGSFQQNRINLYIKSYENRRFFGVFRRCGCIFYVFFCSISYWFTALFVDFVVLICIYTKLRMQFWCLYVYVLCMYCVCICIVIEHVRCTCMYMLYIYITFNI